MNTLVNRIVVGLLTTSTTLRRLLTLGYMALIALLSLLPSSTFKEIPTLFDAMDKVVHLLMYGGMASLLCWTVQRESSKTIMRLLLIFTFCVAFGMLMEILQGTFPGLHRSFDWDDEAANMTGAAVFIPLAERLLSKR